MRKIYFLMLMLVIGNKIFAQFNINAVATNYTQDFNSLTNGTWTDNLTLAGWYARTDATASITSYAANTGATTAAGLYAFGVAGTNPLSDRGIGYAPSNAFTGGSGTGKGYIGWRIKNNTGSAISSITVTWSGEQWRRDNTTTQSLSLSYQVGTTVTALTGGTWTTTGSTFSSLQNTTGGALDGNAPANTTVGISIIITAAIPAGEEIMLRWEDLNDSGNDHFLAIDDVTINATAASGNSNTSDIIFNTGFTTPTNINYTSYQATDITDANSLEVAQFTIRDGGASAPDADVLGTTLTALTFSLSNSANIRRIALYDGATELAEVAGGAAPNFTGLTLAATDDGSKTFSVRVSFNASVTDNQQFQLAVTSATADIAGSVFAAGNAGGATSSTAGDDNRIEVTADRLAFVQNTTSPTGVSVAMTPAPTVSANDVNANRDLDFTAFIDITSTGTLLGTPVSTQAVAGLSTFSGAIIHTVAGTGLQLTAASTGLTSATSNLFNIQVASSATDYFRSAVATGNWNDVGSWESSPDNSTWNPSTLVPDANSNIITILNGHNITVAIAAGGDQIVVEAGGTLTLNANFTLADGTGTDLDVSGTVVNTSGTHVFTGTIAFGANSLYQHNRNGGPVLTATWNVTSTAEITGVTTSQPTAISLGQTFGNFTWNCPSQSSSIGLGNPAGFAIAGNLTVTNTGGVSGRAFRFTSGTPYTLTVGGNLTLNGGHLGLSSGTGTMALTVAGNVSISNSSELYLSQAGSALGTLNIGGDLSINNATLTETGSANGIVIFNKNGTQSFSASSATISNIVNYTITNTSTLLVNSGFPVNTGATLTVDGTLIAAATLTNSGSTNINGTLQINSGGSYTGANGPLYGPASLLRYNTGGVFGRGNEFFCSGGLGCPNNIQISNNTELNVPNGAIFANGQVQGNLTIDAGSAMSMDYGSIGQNQVVEVYKDVILNGTLSLGDAAGGDLHVRGNWTKDAAAIFNPNSRAVIFNGGTDQTITGETTFGNLVVNKSTGSLLLANNASCTNGLTLTSGKIVLGANDLSLLNNFPSALSASSSSSYVVTNGAGAFRRAIGTAFIGQNYHFQVGTLSNLQTAVITFSTLGTDNSLAARFITGPAGNAGLPLTEGGDNLVRVANDGYWEVNMASPTTNVYTGAFIAKAFTDITDYTKLHLVKRTDAFSNWQLNGTHIATSGSNVLANLQRSGMAGFSQFAVGGESNISLPVSLLSFSGYKDGSRNQLSWTTASELNNRGFEVQRSTDGVNYTAIGFVSSLATGGNSNDQLSYRFTDNTPAGVKQYYRLRQEDIDGRSKLSTIVLINGARPTVIALRSIFPNPASVTASMIVDAPSAVKLTVLVTDMAGRNMVQQIVNVSEGSNTVSLNIASLQSGTYLLRVMSEEGEVVTGKLVKQ